MRREIERLMYYYPGVEVHEVEVEEDEDVRGGNLSLVTNHHTTPTKPVHDNANPCDVELLISPIHST